MGFLARVVFGGGGGWIRVLAPSLSKKESRQYHTLNHRRREGFAFYGSPAFLYPNSQPVPPHLQPSSRGKLSRPEEAAGPKLLKLNSAAEVQFDLGKEVAGLGF